MLATMADIGKSDVTFPLYLVQHASHQSSSIPPHYYLPPIALPTKASPRIHGSHSDWARIKCPLHNKKN